MQERRKDTEPMVPVQNPEVLANGEYDLAVSGDLSFYIDMVYFLLLPK